MSQEKNNDLSNYASLGKYLESVRIEKGYTIEDVVSAINIQKYFLVALEQDDYTVLPEKTYALGYLRGYAKFLEIPNVDDLVDWLGKTYSFQQPSYSESIQYEKINLNTNMQIYNSKQNKAYNKLIIYIILFIIISCIAVIAFYQVYKKEDKSIKSTVSVSKKDTIEDKVLQDSVFVSKEKVSEATQNASPTVKPQDTKTETTKIVTSNNIANTLEGNNSTKDDLVAFNPVIIPYPKENLTRYLEINFDYPVKITIYSKQNNKLVYLHKVFKPGETYQVPGVSGLAMDISDYKGAYLIVDTNILYLKPNKLNSKTLYNIDLDKNNLLRKYKS